MSKRLASGLIELEGGCNFREVSGYLSEDGRCLRPGLLFRSGVLSYFTFADQDRLRSLGIRTIVDLRRAEERRREPTRWDDPRTRVLHMEQAPDPPPVMRAALRDAPDPHGMRQLMLELYRAMPDFQAGRLRVLLESLMVGETPVLVHCSAGKDRTGFVVAVLLEALGIAREQVLHDYGLTNTAVDLERFVFECRTGAGVADDAHPLKRIPAAVRQVLLTADPAYLCAAFERLEADYGSVQGYLQRRLGLDAGALGCLRGSMLCEQPVTLGSAANDRATP